MEEFAQALHAFKFGTVDAWGGKSRLFDLSSEGRYAWVYGDGKTVWNDLSDDEFDELAAIWFICSESRELMRDFRDREIQQANERADEERGEIVKSALYMRWIEFSAIGELLRAKYEADGRDLNRDLRKLGKPKWLDDRGATYAALKEYCEVAGEVLIKCYRAARGAPRVSQQRNWYRSRDTLTDIRNEIVDSQIGAS